MKVKTTLLAIALLVMMSTISLCVGVRHFSPLALLHAPAAHSQATLILFASRVPRTIALLLAGSGMAVAGTIMQMISRNRFVDPSTTGTAESAGFGMLSSLIVAPGLPVFARMICAAIFAIAGTSLFLFILRRIPLRSAVMVPLIGIMLSGVVHSMTAFLAYRYDLVQTMVAWTMGDFSGILRGRYEMLWIAFALTVVAYVAADRFTVAGMGEEFATNLGLNYRSVVCVGLVIVSLVSASVVVTAGIVPFVGLIVPNLVSMISGDRLRSTLPLVAISGAALVLICDIAGRALNAPYEIPVGSVLGVVGAVFFLYLLTGRRRHAV